MKILLIGSMAFVKDMVELREALKKMGHDASIPVGSEPHIEDNSFVDNLEDNLEFCIKHGIMKKNFDEVARQDAVLVVNKPRNNVNGYIGTSALLEMGIAHYLGKKIFVLNELPHYRNHRWAHEVAIMQPVVINNDLRKIN